MTQIQERISQLETELSSLKALVTTMSQGEPSSNRGEDRGPTSRRQLLKLGGAAAVGAVGAAVVGAAPAEAASGDNVILGSTSNDSGTDPTQWTCAATGNATLSLFNTGAAGGLYVQTLSGEYPAADIRNYGNNGGVSGTAAGSGVGVAGLSNSGYGVLADGGKAPLLMTPAGVVGHPTSGSHQMGEIFVDSEGALFQCVASGTPGTWVRIGFNPLTPVRILDTRDGTGGINGPIHAGQSVNLTVGGKHGVPTPASAIVMNATVTDTTSASFLTIWPRGATQPLASNLNWAAAETIPNLVTVKLGTGGGISIFNDLGDVQVILDLAGFYS